jgi:hypothetical protein
MGVALDLFSTSARSQQPDARPSLKAAFFIQTQKNK